MPRVFAYGRYKTSSAPSATPALSWTTTITAVGATGDVWEAELMGQKVQYVQAAGNTTTDVADGLAAAIDALAGITSTNAGAVMTTTRTSAPTLFTDPVSNLAVRCYKPDHPFHGASAGAFTQVEATAGTGFDEFAVWNSAPQPH
jgi:hypothetical protein